MILPLDSNRWIRLEPLFKFSIACQCGQLVKGHAFRNPAFSEQFAQMVHDLGFPLCSVLEFLSPQASRGRMPEISQPGQAGTKIALLPSRSTLQSSSTSATQRQAARPNHSDQRPCRARPSTRSILRNEPSHLFLVDRTLGIYVNHHGCDKPIPDQSFAPAFQDSPHVPCDDVLIGIRQCFSLILGETSPSPKCDLSHPGSHIGPNPIPCSRPLTMLASSS